MSRLGQTKNIQSLLFAQKFLRDRLRLSYITQIQLQPHDLPIPRAQAPRFQFFDGLDRTGFIPGSEVDFSASTREMVNSPVSDACATSYQ